MFLRPLGFYSSHFQKQKQRKTSTTGMWMGWFATKHHEHLWRMEPKNMVGLLQHFAFFWRRCSGTHVNRVGVSAWPKSLAMAALHAAIWILYHLYPNIRENQPQWCDDTEADLEEYHMKNKFLIKAVTDLVFLSVSHLGSGSLASISIR